jgi:hypothetical protein
MHDPQLHGSAYPMHHTTLKPNRALASRPNHASLTTPLPARRDAICSLAAAAFLVLLSACDARRSGPRDSESRSVLQSQLTDPADTYIPVPDWTDFTPSFDTQHVYVSSSSGNDSNNGLSPQTAKRTIPAAVQLLRPNRPDWLHVKRGDTFSGPMGDWYLSGRSATEPMVVTTYGTSNSRPLFQCGASDGLTVHSTAISDVAFFGLHFDANTYDGSNGAPYGISFLMPCTRVLVEDCKVERFLANRLQGWGGTHHDLKLRRSVIADSYTTGSSHAQGLYCELIDGLLIEECVFDHNGWRDNVPGAIATIYRHNIYVQDTTSNVVVRGNIIARGGSHGLQARSGGVVHNNFLLGNSLNMHVGMSFSSVTAHVASVIGNVILDGRNISASEPRGWGMTLQSLGSGEIANNVCAHNTNGYMPLSYDFDSGPGVGLNNLDFHHNISYKWGGPSTMSSNRFSGIQLRNNDMQDFFGAEMIHASYGGLLPGITSSNNRFYSTLSTNAWMFYNGQNMSLASWKQLVNDTTSVALQASYPRANETIVQYDLATGGSGSLASFMSRARNQSRLNWNSQLVGTNCAAYFRSNFGLQ